MASREDNSQEKTSGMYKYAVIEFSTSNESFVTAVPICWLDEENMVCQWPRKNERQAIIKNAKPQQDWQILEGVKILEKFATYQEALFKEKKAVQTSESETDLYENDKRKVKKPNKYREEMISPPPTLEEENEDEDTSTENILERVTPEEIAAAPMVIVSNNGTTTLDNEKINKILADILDKIIEVNTQISLLNLRFDNLERSLTTGVFPVTGTGSRYTNKDVLPDLPLKSVAEIVALEDLINENSECRNQLANFIKYVGGTNEKQFIYRTLERIFSNYVGQFCSWTGKKGNFKLQGLRIFEILKDAAAMNYQALTDKNFEDSVMAWFKHSKVRFNREK